MPNLFTQENRFLYVETPLGKDKLLLRSFAGTEGISQLFHFDLDLLSEDNAVNLDQIVGQNVTFSMLQADNKTERFFNGFVSRFGQLPEEGRFTRYHAEVVPWLWFLTRAADCRIFQNMKIPDIIQEVFRDLDFRDFEVKLQRSYKDWDYCVQYRETAFNFVTRLMEQEGIFYFFRHENGKHVLVMADAASAHKPCPFQSKAPYEHSGGPGLAAKEDAVLSWRPEKEFRPGKYTLNDFNFETPKTSLVSTIDSKIRVGGNSKYEVYDYPGEYESKDEGDTWARLRMEEEELPHMVVTGESNCRSFGAGLKFDLSEHSRRDQNASYVLTSVQHNAQEGGTYASSGGAEFEYRNSFTCIPAAVSFRAPRTTPKPSVQGCQTALVVGPPGEEIHVDKYGRVKVQFHWDRRGKYNEKSSYWIRVAQAWTGKRWGAMWIPRVGQEVIVDFLEGDPDQPIIIGRVYNAESMPPYSLPDEKTKSSIKSYSSKGGGGFNEIRFEDKKGKEQVFLHAEKNQDNRVKKDSLEWVGSDRHLIIGQDQLEEVKGDKHLQVKGDQNEKVDGTVSLKVGMDQQEKVGMNHALDAGMAIHLKAGMNVVIESGVTLTLKVGGNFINLNPAGVFISGTLVMINSGGAAGSGSGASPQAPKDPKEADKAEPGQMAELPPPKPPPKPAGSSPKAAVLVRAAQDGSPFCDI